MYLVLEPPAWRAWTRQRRGRKAEKSPGHQIRGQNIITPGNEGAGGGRRHPRSGSHLYREEAIGRRSGEALSCHSPRRARWSAPRPRRWPAPRTAASPTGSPTAQWRDGPFRALSPSAPGAAVPTGGRAGFRCNEQQHASCRCPGGEPGGARARREGRQQEGEGRRERGGREGLQVDSDKTGGPFCKNVEEHVATCGSAWSRKGGRARRTNLSLRNPISQVASLTM